MAPATAPAMPHEAARKLRDQAQKGRAEWLVSLDAGLLTSKDLFEEASAARGKHLLRIPLRQVLLSTKGIGEARATKVLDRIRRLLGVSTPARDMTVGWLLDSRAGGRRFMAWVDATAEHRSEPWSGFPYSSPLVTAGRSQSGFESGGNSR